LNLSVIVPAYNEERTLQRVVEELHRMQLPAFVQQLEIVIVNDCSTDQTKQIAESLAVQYATVKALHHAVNKGKGGAVFTGATAATGDCLIVQDADLELLPKDIPSMLHAMHELQLPFINGSRYMPGVPRPVYTYSRYIGNKVFTWFTSVVLNARLTDMACGYKLIEKKFFLELNLKEKRFGFEAEMIVKALRKRRNLVAEVPVHYTPRGAGEGKKLNNSDAFTILWVIIKYGILGRK
jgi:glycosyltransferase involved in cell wall biosynthesis